MCPWELNEEGLLTAEIRRGFQMTISSALELPARERKALNLACREERDGHSTDGMIMSLWHIMKGEEERRVFSQGEKSRR